MSYNGFEQAVINELKQYTEEQVYLMSQFFEHNKVTVTPNSGNKLYWVYCHVIKEQTFSQIADEHGTCAANVRQATLKVWRALSHRYKNKRKMIRINVGFSQSLIHVLYNGTEDFESFSAIRQGWERLMKVEDMIDTQKRVIKRAIGQQRVLKIEKKKLEALVGRAPIDRECLQSSVGGDL